MFFASSSATTSLWFFAHVVVFAFNTITRKHMCSMQRDDFFFFLLYYVRLSVTQLVFWSAFIIKDVMCYNCWRLTDWLADWLTDFIFFIHQATHNFLAYLNVLVRHPHPSSHPSFGLFPSKTFCCVTKSCLPSRWCGLVFFYFFWFLVFI